MRQDILSDIILLKGNLEHLETELSQFPWDSEVELYECKIEHFRLAIEKCLANEISFSELTDWANIIECRDDVGFETEVLQQHISDLANAEINQINIETLPKILSDLS